MGRLSLDVFDNLVESCVMIVVLSNFVLIFDDLNCIMDGGKPGTRYDKVEDKLGIVKDKIEEDEGKEDQDVAGDHGDQAVQALHTAQ